MLQYSFRPVNGGVVLMRLIWTLPDELVILCIAIIYEHNALVVLLILCINIELLVSW